MNIKNIVVATALIMSATAAAAGSAFAEAPYPGDKPFVSTKTRAQVVAELKEAGGNIARDNYAATFSTSPANGGKTRAQVLAELKDVGADPSRSNYIDTTH